MNHKSPVPKIIKPGFHPRNPHRMRYDFDQLTEACSELAPFVQLTRFNTRSIDFADPQAVKMLNKALIKQFYGISNWDIPAEYLCPAIPGRADYIHYMADLLASFNKGIVPVGPNIRVLDIGVGANCVYPIIGNRSYGWSFTGTDVDPVAINSANRIIESNPSLTNSVKCKLQNSKTDIITNAIADGEYFDFSICNPPFHASAAEAANAAYRKVANLSSEKQINPVLNFGGMPNELWCEGGEADFVIRMVKQSAELPSRCMWYTSLISKSTNLPAVQIALKKLEAGQVRIIEMAQGQKQSRIIAWTFLTGAQIKEWRIRNWKTVE